MSSELYAYTITAHPRRDQNQQLRIDALLGDAAGGDLLEAFDTLIVKGAEWPLPPEEGAQDTRRTLARVDVIQKPLDDSRVRWGRVRVSREAVRHDVEQAQTGETIAILDEDREGRPLFFWLVAPTRSTSVLVLTERRARFGIVTGFWRTFLLGHLRASFPGITFDLNYYVPEPVWDQYLQRGDDVRGLVLRRVLAEDRENIELDTPTRRRPAGTLTTYVDRRVVPRRERVAQALQANDRPGAVELVLGEQANSVGDVDRYDSVSLRLTMAGKRRTVALGREIAPQIGYPVSDVGQDHEGYPLPQDMARFASELAREIGGPLGIR